MEPILFRDLNFRSSRQLLSLGRTLACNLNESACSVKVAEWTRSVTFAPPLFALVSRDGRVHHSRPKNERAAAEVVLRIARRLRSLALPDTSYYYNHRLLASLTSNTTLPPLRHLSIAVHSDLLGYIGHIASLVVLEELSVFVQYDILPSDHSYPKHFLTAKIKSWNLPLLRTLSIDLSDTFSESNPVHTMMLSFLSRCTLARLQELKLCMGLDEDSTSDFETTQRFSRFLAHHRHILRVCLDPGPEDECCPWNSTWQSITSSVRAPTLGLAHWFDSTVIDGLADDVKTLELTSITPVHMFDASGFSTPFPLLDICVARAASGTLGPRKIVLKSSPSQMAPRTSREAMLRAWRAQRSRAYTIYGTLCLAYAAQLCRAGIGCDIDEVLVGKSAFIIASAAGHSLTSSAEWLHVATEPEDNGFLLSARRTLRSGVS
jgi:hypothetical protein